MLSFGEGQLGGFTDQQGHSQTSLLPLSTSKYQQGPGTKFIPWELRSPTLWEHQNFYSVPVLGIHVPLPQGHSGIPTSFKGLCVYVCVFPFYMCPGNHKQIQVTKKRKKNGLQLKHPFCLQIIRDINIFSISGSPKHPFHVKTPHYNIFDNSIFFFNFIYLFIYLWLCWVFVSVRGLSLVAASRSHSSSRCAGLSLLRPLLLRSTGSRRAGSVVVAHRPSCSAACGIFPDQGSNPCPLHWQADFQPLRHQGSSW